MFGREISYDEAIQVLLDWIYDVVEYNCKDCGAQFFYWKDDGQFCVKCGSKNLEVVRETKYKILE